MFQVKQEEIKEEIECPEYIETSNEYERYIKQENINEDIDPLKDNETSDKYTINYKQEPQIMAPKCESVDIKKRQSWDKEAMQQAIEDVREKRMGYLKAANKYQIPKTTLRRLVLEKRTSLNVVTSHSLGRKPVLSACLEKELEKYIQLMEAKLFGLTRKDIKVLAFQLAEKNNIPHRFNKQNGLAGKDWLNSFLKRHPNLSFGESTGTSKGFCKVKVDEFFDNLEKVTSEVTYTPNNIYNVEETGITVVPSKIPQILTLKGKLQVESLAFAERGSLITTVLCMSAAGNYIPPLFIFPCKKRSPLLFKGAPPGAIYECHKSGWIETNIFTIWFKHFLKHAKPSEKSPVLLLLDGHTSHTRNIEVLELASKNNVCIVTIPPNSNHKMQPINRTFMGPFKKYLFEELRVWFGVNARPITHFDMLEIFTNAYLRTTTREIAVQGFEATGVYPLDRNKITNLDFIATNNQDISLRTKVDQEVVALSTSVQSEPMPSTSAQTEPKSSDSAQSKPLLFPNDIFPVLRLRKSISHQRRSGEKSQILNSSPYKNLLRSRYTNLSN